MPAPARSKPPRSRLPAAERKALLSDLAARAFAEHGFALATRDIARHCDVTQALLYKYFGSKAGLVEAVLASRFLKDGDGPNRTLLTNGGTLEERVAAFYISLCENASAINLRLFLRAALDGLDLPKRYGQRLDERIFRPVLDALRSDLAAPPCPPEPLTQAARELAMALHGGAVFTMIRQEVYGTEFPQGIAPVIERLTRIWCAGARREMNAILALENR